MDACTVEGKQLPVRIKCAWISLLPINKLGRCLFKSRCNERMNESPWWTISIVASKMGVTCKFWWRILLIIAPPITPPCNPLLTTFSRKRSEQDLFIRKSISLTRIKSMLIGCSLCYKSTYILLGCRAYYWLVVTTQYIYIYVVLSSRLSSFSSKVLIMKWSFFLPFLYLDLFSECLLFLVPQTTRHSGFSNSDSRFFYPRNSLFLCELYIALRVHEV